MFIVTRSRITKDGIEIGKVMGSGIFLFEQVSGREARLIKEAAAQQGIENATVSRIGRIDPPGKR